MTTLKDLLGEELLQHNRSNHISTNQLNNKTVALYFSAYWCSSCRVFTSQLAEIYMKLAGTVRDKLDVIFVSYDEDQSSFEEYFKEMPWKAISFTDRIRAQSLGTRLRVKSIPCLVVLSSSCEVLTWAGVREVHSLSEQALQQWSEGKVHYWTREPYDNEYVWDDISCSQCYMFPLLGKRHECVDRECTYNVCESCILNSEHEHPLFEHLFPKKQYSVAQLFSSIPYLLDPQSDIRINKDTLWNDGVKSIGLYFSDFWSRSRSEFTPVLIQSYREILNSDYPFKIVFISNDFDEIAFNEYRAEMPWPAIPFHFGTAIRALFCSSEISLLSIVSIDGEVLTRNGHDVVLRKGVEALKIWSKGKRIPQPAIDEFSWLYIQCGRCQMNPLIGQRYRCFSCINLDLCSVCAKLGHEHPLELCAQLNEGD